MVRTVVNIFAIIFDGIIVYTLRLVVFGANLVVFLAFKNLFINITSAI